MIKHTPGPWDWFTDPLTRSKEITRPHGLQMKFLVGGNGQGFCHTVGLGEPDDSANANLISAAPDMLSALKAMTHLMQEAADEIYTDVRHPLRGYGGKTVRENIHAANEAIKKAEGS